MAIVERFLGDPAGPGKDIRAQPALVDLDQGRDTYAAAGPRPFAVRSSMLCGLSGLTSADRIALRGVVISIKCRGAGLCEPRNSHAGGRVMRFPTSARKMFFASLLVFGSFLATSAVSAVDPPKEADESAKLLAEQVCATCHGQHGLSTFQEIPSLAAQTQVYIAAKLWQFRSQSQRRPEQHADLLGVALMDDATVEALARYFAGQPGPTPVMRDAVAVESGGKIFREGIADKGVAACAACHGTSAQGFWIAPRLAGQHARYVERQLKEIQLQLRRTRVMHGVVKDLSLDEIKAVAAFVQSK